MDFEIRNTKNKNRSVYKTIYLTQELAEKVEKIATENHTSFNNIVISMIEACLPKDKNND